MAFPVSMIEEARSIPAAAATKSYVMTLVQATRLLASIAEDRGLAAACPFVAALARARGLSPDDPPHLAKVTETR